jgi:hypothetical protein
MTLDIFHPQADPLTDQAGLAAIGRIVVEEIRASFWDSRPDKTPGVILCRHSDLAWIKSQVPHKKYGGRFATFEHLKTAYISASTLKDAADPDVTITSSYSKGELAEISESGLHHPEIAKVVLLAIARRRNAKVAYNQADDDFRKALGLYE